MAHMKWFNEGNQHFQDKQYNQAIECWEKVLEIGRQEQIDQVIANATINIGTVYGIKGEWNKSLQYFHESLEIERKIENNTGIVECLIKIGDAFFALEKWENARDFYKQSLDIFEGEDYEKARILHNIGLSLFFNGEWNQAIEYYKQSLESFKEIKDLEGISKVLANLGIAARNLGRWEDAIKYYRQSLKIDEKLGNKYGIATCLMNIGIALEMLGSIKEAIEYYQNSLQQFRELNDEQAIAMCLLNIGNAFQFLKKWEKSLDFYQKSLKKFEQLKDKTNVSKCLTNIGIVLRNLGKWEEAISNYHKSLKWFESINDLAALSKCFLDLGVAYYTVRKWDMAEKYYQQSRELFQKLGDRPGEALACQNLGWGYQERNEMQLAFKYFTEALGIYTTLITPITSSEYRESYEKEFEELPKIIESLREILTRPLSSISEGEMETGPDVMNNLFSQLNNNITELNTALKTQTGYQNISQSISGLMDLVKKTRVTFSQTEKSKSEKISRNIFDLIKICNDLFTLYESSVKEAGISNILKILKQIHSQLGNTFPELDLIQTIYEAIMKVEENYPEILSEAIALELQYLILTWIKHLYGIALSNRKLYLETLGKPDEITGKLEGELRILSEQISSEDYNYSAQVLGYLIVTRKLSGLPIYQWNFIEATFDPDLVAGFLSAIQSFGREITRDNGTTMEKLAYKNFEINFFTGKYIRCALILKGILTEFLAKQLKMFVLDFETEFEKHLKVDTGEVRKFKDAQELVEKYFVKEKV